MGIGLAVQDPDQRMVAVPARPDADKQLVLEARQLPDGLVLPMFSSVGALVSTLGQSQPWVILSLPQIAELAVDGGVDFLMLDPEVSGDAWRWEEQDLAGFSWKADR